ncbi:hypothetical protein MJ905_23245 [Klebsiella michiganensis]|uniref:Uncharacterized protein n=1 Tax=Klebsiella michiganensis TaxID=1134687 RepID=A0AB35Q3E2_9ENTR|nr:hypothetical protein [Klebsiella michiganensis]MDU1358020.1 hypothetical protein [Citrobacter freundii]MCW9454101.1 hypothetical protein [Klebsiella michiganensis]MCW9512355.1 hypothetical protein [Klebsiella michiganensis]MCW9598073.1 hypothetical protein [Klebsiella michiganensis]MDK8024973.1 hypothetical protein [Klebsiella michiganensis]
MLLPVLVRDGKNLHRASARPAYPRSAPHVCRALYDAGRKHTCPTKDPRSPRHKNDHALRPPGP